MNCLMVKVICACRGDGVAYVELGSVDPKSLVRVRTEEGVELPSASVALRSDSCAVAFPLAETACYVLDSIDAGWALTVTAFCLKMHSKIAYAFRRKRAACLRDFDLRDEASCFGVRFVQVIEDGDQCVIRAYVDAPPIVSTHAPIEVTVLGVSGAAASISPIILEDCADALDIRGRAVRRLTVSVRVSAEEHRIGLAASSPGGLCQPCGCMLLDDMYAALKKNFSNMILDAAKDPAYHAWWKSKVPTNDELRRQSAHVFDHSPLFSIVVPLYRTPVAFFDDMLASVCRQSFQNWELILVNASPDDENLAARLSGLSDKRIRIVDASNEGIAQNTNIGIKNACGDYLCFLDHDDLIAPNALFEYARAVELNPRVDLMYCDEDRFDGSGYHSVPFFKPDYSPELLRSHNYITHFLCISNTCVNLIGLMDGAFNGAQDFDYTLRASECARAIMHVPHVLYHWRLHECSTSMNPESKSYAKNAGLEAVQAHCDRLGFRALVERTEMPFAYRVRKESRDWGQVDIVIPTKDHSDLLRVCVNSILNVCSYQNYRIILVENNSSSPETFACYDEFRALDSRVDLVVWPNEFNYSKIVNFGAAHGQGSYILFLNNDTEVISPDFLETMLGYFEDEDVGVVGAKLLYADKTVQHAGVGVGLLGAAAHLFVSLPVDAGGYFDRARLPQNLSAVTGACQLVRRDLFECVGGYSEEFTVGYNDVDFCLKVGDTGHRVVYTPYALLYHFEFSSRGRDMRGKRMKRVERETDLLRTRWSLLFENGDPYLNSNLSMWSCYFSLGEEGGDSTYAG